jgi:hypothetical protein
VGLVGIHVLCIFKLGQLEFDETWLDESLELMGGVSWIDRQACTSATGSEIV